jgi:hypothetical protein
MLVRLAPFSSEEMPSIMHKASAVEKLTALDVG